MQYLVVIHKDKDSDYGVIVPDLPGCFSAGDTLENASNSAREAIECHIEGLLLEGDPIPMPSTFDSYAGKKEFKSGIWVLIDIDLTKLSGKTRRVNVTLPERILRCIDQYTQAHGGNRSAFIADAAMKLISVEQGRSFKTKPPPVSQ